MHPRVSYPYSQSGKESLVYNAHNKDLICVNSFHHQAVRMLQLPIVTARSEDGIIEGLSMGRRSAVGVQWHLELMWERIRFLELFKVFVDYR